MKSTRSAGAAVRPRLFTAGYLLLMLISLATAMGYSMIATLITSYAVGFGASLSLAGTVGGIFSLAALLTRPVSGLLCDRCSKRNICIAATAAICLCFAGYALTPNIGCMLLFRVLHGAAFGVCGTANLALVSEIIPKERMGEGLGYFGLGQILSQVCGPVIGNALKDRIGFHALFFLITGLTALAILLLLLYPDAAPQRDASHAHSLAMKDLIAGECLVYALIAGMFSLTNGVVNSFLVLVGQTRGIAGVSLFFTVNAALLFCIRLFMGRVADRSSLSVIVTASLVTGALSMFVLAKAWSLPLVLLAAALKAFGQGAGQISLQSACIKKVDAARIGVATSTYYIGADIGNTVGPTLGGWISDSQGYGVMFWIVGGLLLAASVFFLAYERRSAAASRA